MLHIDMVEFASLYSHYEVKFVNETFSLSFEQYHFRKGWLKQKRKNQDFLDFFS